MRVYYDLFVREKLKMGEWKRVYKDFSTEEEARLFIQRIKDNVTVKSITLDTWHTEN